MVHPVPRSRRHNDRPRSKGGSTNTRRRLCHSWIRRARVVCGIGVISNLERRSWRVASSTSADRCVGQNPTVRSYSGPRIALQPSYAPSPNRHFQRWQHCRRYGDGNDDPYPCRHQFASRPLFCLSRVLPAAAIRPNSRMAAKHLRQTVHGWVVPGRSRDNWAYSGGGVDMAVSGSRSTGRAAGQANREGSGHPPATGPSSSSCRSVAEVCDPKEDPDG